MVLARSGLSPMVLERHLEPHDALCGGFLSWSTAGRLRFLGVDPEMLGAHSVDCVRLFAGRQHAESRLPKRCWSLSRRVLDAALLTRAEAEGVRVERGVKVVNLAENRAELADGSSIEADALVLATGKHDLRGAGRDPGARDPALGLRWRLAPTERLSGMARGTVELHLFAGGYAGLALQEDGAANLCMAVKRSLLTSAGGDPLHLLERLAADNPALTKRIEAAGSDPGPAQAVANVPYGWIAACPAQRAMRIGDQAAVIPSLAGEGMAIALASGVAAGQAILTGLDAARFQRRLARRVQFPVMVAGAISGGAAHALGAAAMVGAVRLVPALSGIAARLSRVPGEPDYSIPPG